jgi:TRAP-type mannitol/chloroaromatic compound transport system substrate-binding protein
VSLPTGEYYLSGQTGVVDGLVWCGAQEGYTNSWHEVYTYMLSNPINGTFFGTWIINEDQWNSLPADLQAIFYYGLDSLSRHCLSYYYREPEFRQYFELNTFSKEDWMKFREPQLARWDEYADESPRMAQAMQIIRDYNESVETQKWYR